jgi:hypothetical protein
MANDMYVIDALQMENAALRLRVAELVRLLAAAQDACDTAEAEWRRHERRQIEQNMLQRLPAEPIGLGACSLAVSRLSSNNDESVS